MHKPLETLLHQLCDGLGEEIEDGWFDAFVPREIAFEPEEDEVEGDSVNQSCDSKYHRSDTNSSSEAHCSATSKNTS